MTCGSLTHAKVQKFDLLNVRLLAWWSTGHAHLSGVRFSDRDMTACTCSRRVEKSSGRKVLFCSCQLPMPLGFHVAFLTSPTSESSIRWTCEPLARRRTAGQAEMTNDSPARCIMLQRVQDVAHPRP